MEKLIAKNPTAYHNYTIDSTLEDKTVDNFHKTLDVNLIGTFLTCKHIGTYMNDTSKVIMLQAELIEKLLDLNRETISLLSQYMACDEYENKLKEIAPEALNK